MFFRFGVFLICAAMLAACARQQPISRPGPKREPPVRTAPPPPPIFESAPVFEAPPPANDPLPPLRDQAPQAESGSVPRLALLLPLSGSLASSSEAIRDGFMAAHYSRGAPGVVRIYDSGADANSVRTAYADALRDGARAIAGPLRKEDVLALADMGAPAVPVLALNYLDANRPAPADLYQFGLSAEDEAAAAARDAAAQGLRRALTLTPQGEWGERALDAFTQAFAERGGVVSRAERYDASAIDFADPIRALLAINDSRERHRALTNLLGVKPEFEPRRRGDADLIFFAARGAAVRQMAPQLRFHRASGLPIYATAQVYSGGEPSAELNGVRFCDGPWMTESAGLWASARNEAQVLFPNRAADLTRLNALGYDAYALVSLLAQQRRPQNTVPAATGRLTLATTGIVSRELSCVEVAGNALKATR